MSSQLPYMPLEALCLNTFCNPAKAAEKLKGCGAPIESLFQTVSRYIRNRDGENALVLKRCDDLISMAHEKLYACLPVPSYWKELYFWASMLRFSVLVLRKEMYGAEVDKWMDLVVKTIDMALIMTGPPRDEVLRESVEEALRLLQKMDSCKCNFYRVFDKLKLCYSNVVYRMRLLSLITQPSSLHNKVSLEACVFYQSISLTL